jgi:hypothetical protein
MFTMSPPSQTSVVIAARWIYGVGAVSNWLVTIPAFVIYNRAVDLFAETPPNYPFLVWIWSGMAFLWGVMFWEIRGDPIKKQPFMKYSYLEKAVTSTSVVVAYVIGDVPGRFLLGVVFTDIIWIPLFIWVHVKIRRLSGQAR